MTRKEIIQECINALTAFGANLRDGANDSWRQGVFDATELLRQLMDRK